MNISEWWQALVLPQRWSVAGVSVRALSVWHLHALEQSGNRFVVGGHVTMDDVASLLLICRTDYESGRALFLDDRRVRRESKRIFHKLKKHSDEQAIGMAFDYFATCTNSPDRWSGDSKGRPLAAPLSRHIVLCLCDCYGFDYAEAWNHAYTDARCMYETWRETQGDDALVTEEQRRLIAEAERIKAEASK